jgi:hypothetical protein
MMDDQGRQYLVFLPIMIVCRNDVPICMFVSEHLKYKETWYYPIFEHQPTVKINTLSFLPDEFIAKAWIEFFRGIKKYWLTIQSAGHETLQP